MEDRELFELALRLRVGDVIPPEFGGNHTPYLFQAMCRELLRLGDLIDGRDGKDD